METSEQTIEVVSTVPGNSENLDNSQIQCPICEKCSEEITIEFPKQAVFFLPCKRELSGTSSNEQVSAILLQPVSALESSRQDSRLFDLEITSTLQ
ncbi:hypothetical protein C1645_830725 [Glomus cerebriforme]|uniref:Uncharacterized protein n=1 Tax=Glomus cerebriforme TaxID=658196 RepID=A0A397SRM8_9GLOM|nr:hypothetical protein C1645_830725 [Glomus cerebriforme]